MLTDALARRARRLPWLVQTYRAGRAGVQRAARGTEVRLRHVVERRRLEPFRDRHRGERAFVIGNGPSLRGVDLRPLAQETTIVTNHFYLHPQLELLRPTYYCASDLWFFDPGTHPGWALHLSGFPGTTVMLLPVEVKRRVGIGALRDRPNVHYLRCDRRREIWRDGEMNLDAAGVLGTGDSVVLDFCLPLAHFLGFAEVYLLGCDTDYGPGDGATHFYESRTPTRSVDHHRDTWYRNVTRSYEVARRRFEASGRRIYNATAGGRLHVFPRVDLEEALGHRHGPAPTA